MFHTRKISVLLLSFGLLGIGFFGIGCGGGSGEMKMSSKFTAAHAEFFENGVDYVANPDVLEGRWQEEWQRELEKRLEYSDFIGVVAVNTLRTDIDPGRQTNYRLLANIKETLNGEGPEDGLTLVVKDGEPGYETVDGNQRRLLNQGFIAFVKWYEDENNMIAARWHLSPASENIIQRIRELIQRRDEAKAHVSVVTHKN
jgi:hypothetical protein